MIWFGSGVLPTVVITALICFFPLLENTLTAIQHVDPQKRELFRMLGATKLQTLRRLKIASGLPVILAGVRVAVVLAFVGAVVGEFIGASEGLGALIIGAQGMMDTTLMFAIFIVITVQGMIFYQATLIAERDELVALLDDCGGNVSEVSRRLGVTRGAVAYRLKKYGLA